jgi:hypothetical protein
MEKEKKLIIVLNRRYSEKFYAKMGSSNRVWKKCGKEICLRMSRHFLFFGKNNLLFKSLTLCQGHP